MTINDLMTKEAGRLSGLTELLGTGLAKARGSNVGAAVEDWGRFAAKGKNWGGRNKELVEVASDAASSLRGKAKDTKGMLQELEEVLQSLQRQPAYTHKKTGLDSEGLRKHLSQSKKQGNGSAIIESIKAQIAKATGADSLRILEVDRALKSRDRLSKMLTDQLRQLSEANANLKGATQNARRTKIMRGTAAGTAGSAVAIPTVGQLFKQPEPKEWWRR